MIEQITVSIPQKLYRRVSDLARARNQPVDDVLADVLEQALPADKSSPNNSEEDAVEREMRAFIQMHPMLKKKYLGQHVAMLNGQLIDVDEDYGALYERIDAKYPDQFVWMAKVEDEPMPTLVFRSPRLEAAE
ncbi:MAG: hypothetical protein H6652_00415 [Ardenticatenaceae bacterium]|nr:hypothetical protein [Ardenticatenaceae bacterium]